MVNSSPCLCTCSLVPPDHLGFPRGSPHVPPPSLLNSCSSFKVQPGATSSVKLLWPPTPLCSQPSVHLQYHFPRLSGQSALSSVAHFLLSVCPGWGHGGLYRGRSASQRSTKAEDWGAFWQWRGSHHGFRRRSRLGNARTMVGGHSMEPLVLAVGL